MSNAATIEAIDTGDEHTPENVREARALKASLLKNGAAVAPPSGSVRSRIERATLASPSSPEDELDIDPESEVDDGTIDDSELPVHTAEPILTSDRSSLDILASYLDNAPAREEVKLTGTFGKLTFKAINVSINDFGVAFIVKKDAMIFEPNIETTLVVTYKGKDYNVIYAGGFFTFAKMPFTFVSFLKVSEN